MYFVKSKRKKHYEVQFIIYRDQEIPSRSVINFSQLAG